jgi:hypothetical protein
MIGTLADLTEAQSSRRTMVNASCPKLGRSLYLGLVFVVFIVVRMTLPQLTKTTHARHNR